MRTARSESDRVVVSLFVNPTQFAAGEDFERYPRDFERDRALAEQVGVDVLFAPETSEVYPRVATTVHVPVVTKLWEGAARPHHFEGVATVVCKLFNIVRPTVAYFGWKDLQQCLVIRRMTEDLNLPVQLSFEPTVRETDGLAMSSRNVYLTQEERRLAPLIFEQLSASKRAIGVGANTTEAIDEVLRRASDALDAAGFRVDYFDLIDLENAHPTRKASIPSAIIVAARLGKTRLIDNVLM